MTPAHRPRSLVGFLALALAGLLSACAPQSQSAPPPTSAPATSTAPTAIPAAQATPARSSPTAPPAAQAEPTPQPTSPKREVPVGLDVGNRAPAFQVTTLDGKPLTSADLLAQQKPFILYFFASWCTTCRAEFRLLKDLYPRYADRVGFVAVGIDPSEGPELLRAYKEAQAYPWTVTFADRPMLERYNVVSTSIKYAIDRHGIITDHRGYGVGDSATWERVFEELIQR